MDALTTSTWYDSRSFLYRSTNSSALIFPSSHASFTSSLSESVAAARFFIVSKRSGRLYRPTSASARALTASYSS